MRAAQTRPQTEQVRSELLDRCEIMSDGLLPRDASAERGDATVSRPSVCPSVRL